MGTSVLKIELKIMSGERETSNDLSPPFKEKKKEGEGRSKAWWPKEGEGEGFLLGGQWKEKEKVLFHLFPFSPPCNLLRPSFFSFDIKVLLYHGSRPLFTYSFPFS
jgi:hypothetical protein